VNDESKISWPESCFYKYLLEKKLFLQMFTRKLYLIGNISSARALLELSRVINIFLPFFPFIFSFAFPLPFLFFPFLPPPPSFFSFIFYRFQISGLIHILLHSSFARQLHCPIVFFDNRGAMNAMIIARSALFVPTKSRMRRVFSRGVRATRDENLDMRA